MSSGRTISPTQQIRNLESISHNSTFLHDIQHRVSNVVASCLSGVYYRGSGKNNVIEYANTLGDGLASVFEKYFLPTICSNGVNLQIPLGVLYINTLGIRFKILGGQAAAPERKYDLRVAAFIGDCFSSAADKNEESKRNKEVFKANSSHILKLACDGVVNEPFGIVFKSHRSELKLPDNHVIVIPDWAGNDDLKQSFLSPNIENIKEEKLINMYKWIDDAEIEEIYNGIKSKLKLSEDHYIDNITTRRAIFNLYRLHLNDEHRAKVSGAGIVHLIYLPDVITPNLTPAGFAGFVQLQPDFKENNAFRLFAILQSLISKCFSQTVQSAEAVGLRVTVQGGIESKDSWRGRYISLKSPRETPLIEDLRKERLVTRTRTEEESDFLQLALQMLETLENYFMVNVQPKIDTFEHNNAVQAADLPPLTGKQLEKNLQIPILGYPAIADACYKTFKKLWMDANVVSIGVGEDITLIHFLEELYEREPSMHFLSQYRDHLVHSLHVFMTGLWILLQRKEDKYILFNDLSDKERENLLKLWLMASCLHDTAYPVQKLEDGSGDLFRRYTAKGNVQLDNESMTFYARYAGIFCKPSLADFFHVRIKNATLEQDNGEQKTPLFKVGNSNASVSSGALATWLLERAVGNVCHGVWGAIFLHNHFYSDTGALRSIINNLTQEHVPIYNLSEESITSLCVAIAFHHFYDWFISYPLEEVQKKGWHLETGHPLLFLLVLCDSLAQWGRTREREDNAWHAPDYFENEKQRRVQLLGMGIDVNTNELLIKQYYPNLTNLDEIVKYTKIPLKLLSKNNGVPILKVILAAKEWDGTTTDDTQTCTLTV